jgi:hypothetical protein
MEFLNGVKRDSCRAILTLPKVEESMPRQEIPSLFKREKEEGVNESNAVNSGYESR